MQAWIWITVCAALAQTLRFTLQKQLAQAGLSAAGATFSRFIFSAPVVALLVIAYATQSNQPLPGGNATFWLNALAGGMSQILATVSVMAVFAARNFAVGITLKKTEVLQTALLGFLLLGETIAPLALAAMVLGFVAVLLLSKTGPGAGWSITRLLDRSAALGLLSGALFGISGVTYRAASLALEGGDVALRAGSTLAVVTASQTIAMLIWFAMRDRAQVARVLRAWRRVALVGAASIIGSFCWFSAFTLQQAAYVNAVGQVELIFSILVTTLVFRERISPRELGGIALLGVAILGVVLAV